VWCCASLTPGVHYSLILCLSFCLPIWHVQLPSPFIIPPEMYSVFVKVAHVVPDASQMLWVCRLLDSIDEPVRTVCKELFGFFYTLVSRGGAASDADATAIATELGPYLLRGSDEEASFSLDLNALVALMITTGPALFDEPDVRFAACGTVSGSGAHASVDLAVQSGTSLSGDSYC
jgi:hypothetical protein